MMFERTAVPILVVTALGAIGALIAIPALDLAAPGRVLSWHVAQASFREGALEAIALFAVLLFAASIPRRAGIALAAGAAALYLRRHHVDAPALAALVWFEAIFATGLLVLRAARAPVGSVDDRLQQFLVGLGMVVVVLLAASVAGYGRPRDLLVVGTVLAATVLLAARSEPASLQAIRGIAFLHGGARALAVGLGAWLLVMLARTNQTIGYDGLWYGFRPDIVLAPERSMFDETGLIAPVFYYPKLYELLVMPLSAARDFSFPLAFGVLLLGFGAWTAYDFARRLGAGAALALGAAAIVATVPAIATQALAPKSNLLAGLLVVIAASLFHRGLWGRDGACMAYGIAAGALAVQAKLVAVPYVAALAVAALGCAIFAGGAQPRRWSSPGLAAWTTFAAALLVTIGLTARTFVLTGVPTIGPDPLSHLWALLGFEMRDPVATFDWTRRQAPGDVPQLALDLLLFPTRMLHIVITWIGNAWLWLTAFAAIAAVVLRRRIRVDAVAIALAAPVLAVGMLLALGVAYHFRGGDGSYLIAPIALGSIVAVSLAAAVMRGIAPLERTAFAGLVAASLLHMLVGFANASWSMPGTRALDLDFARSPIDTRAMRRDALVSSGLAQFEEYLRASPRLLRIVGYTDADEDGLWLSASYESLHTLNYLRPDLIYDQAGFRRLLELSRIDVVLLPLRFDPKVHSSAVFAHMADLERAGAVEVREFGAYRAFRLRGT